MKNNKTGVINILGAVGFLSALSTVLIFVGFPLFPMASNLELDFSDVPALIAGVGISPVAGVTVILIKNVLNIVMGGGAHMFWGAFQNAICGLALVFPLSVLAKKVKNNGEVLQKLPSCMVIASLTQMVVAVLTNIIVVNNVSKYVEYFYDVSAAEYVFMVVVFNAVKNVMVCLAFYLVYRYIYPGSKKMLKADAKK